MKQFLFCIVFMNAFAAYSQNVGIGTQNPAYPLDVNGWMRLRYSNTAAALLFNKKDNTGPAVALGAMNDSILGIANMVGNTYRFFFNLNSTRFGINNSNPNAPLSFAPALGKKITLYPGTNGDVGLGVQGNLLQIHSDYAGADIAFGYGSSESFTERMRVKGNGQVGVGTTAPAGKMTVGHYASLGSPTFALYDSALNAPRLQFQNASGNKFWQITAQMDNTAHANSRFNIFHSSQGDMLSVGGDGTVGIGTTANQASLHVHRGTAPYGTAAFEGTTYRSHFNYSTEENTIIRGGQPGSRVYINDLPNGDVVIATGGGRVGINTNDPVTNLDVQGTLRVADGTHGSGKVLTSDANGVASWQSPQVGFAAILRDDLTIGNNTFTTLTGYQEDYDDGEGFNETEGSYTTPVSGTYGLQATIHLTLPSAATATELRVLFYKNGFPLHASGNIAKTASSTDGESLSVNVSRTVRLHAGDILTLGVQATRDGAATHTLTNGTIPFGTYFSCTRFH